MSKSAPSSSGSDTGRKGPRKRFFAYFGVNSLAISILIHVLFGVGATYFIVEHFQKKHINFHATEPPAPPNEVEHKVELAKKNNVESAPPDLKRIVTTDISPISLPTVPEVPQTQEITPTDISGVDGEIGSAMDGGGEGAGGGGGSGAGVPAFGAEDGSGLKGDFYDIKQTSDRVWIKRMYAPKFEAVVDDYLKAHWDESILHQYFRGHQPLYTTRFAISTRDSEEAPKAFNLEREVQPACWVVHYQGRVVAPATGDYRFIGFGDDILIVKIAGDAVIDAGWYQHLADPALHEILPDQWSRQYMASADAPAAGHLKMGKIFHMDANQPVDMDVLIGDQGGKCAFYLMVMKVGNNYERTPAGTPKAPFFQLDTKGPPVFGTGEERPPYGLTPEPWQLSASDQ
jgi:hypothetical protein